MNFSIYLDDAMGQQLNELAQETGQSRNALIRQAISLWLEQQNKPKWPKAVLSFEGVKDMPAFESYRSELGVPNEDPLA